MEWAMFISVIMHNNIIKASATLALLVLSFPALAYNDVSTHARKMASIQANSKGEDQEIESAEPQGEVKYKKGDCIIATNPGDSWHGEYAWVISFGEIAGYPGENYLLLFPSYRTRDVVFGKSIDENTQLVHESLCVKAYTDTLTND
jgi:hypothetical protein